jgi:hypothetical protein
MNTRHADARGPAGYAKSRSGTLASHVAVAGCEPAGRSHPQKRRDLGIRAAWLTAPQAAPLGPE